MSLVWDKLTTADGSHSPFVQFNLLLLRKTTFIWKQVFFVEIVSSNNLFCKMNLLENHLVCVERLKMFRCTNLINTPFFNFLRYRFPLFQIKGCTSKESPAMIGRNLCFFLRLKCFAQNRHKFAQTCHACQTFQAKLVQQIKVALPN